MLEQFEAFYEEHQVIVHIAAVILSSIFSYYIFRRVLVRVLTFTAKRTRSTWDDKLIEQGVARHLPYLAPAAVLYLAAPVFPDVLLEPIRRLTTAYIAVNAIVLFDRVLNTVLAIYKTYPISKERPIKGYIQVVKIFLFIIGGIVVVSLLMNQSPWAFLGGIGAMTAVLLLIFRDTILSFVASIQITTNDMVRVGDWIEMPKYGADGDVIEMALNTIKIQNWDKTITTIPTYKLVEDSFKNWRGMQRSGGRRIARSINLDQSSIAYLEADQIERYMKIDILRPYLEAKREELDRWHEEKSVDLSEPLNGRRLTNLGTFRAYVAAYLHNHPRVNQELTFLVRPLAPGPEGVPLQIYVFANTTVWAEYEGVQADIFDHLLASAPEFGLKVFQKPSGQDITSLRAVAESGGS